MTFEKAWQTISLGIVSKSIQYGHTASALDSLLGPRFLRITDIQNEKVNWKTVPSCTISASDIPKYILESGDLVFARTGATTGKSFLIRQPPQAVFASYLIRVRLSKELNSEFVAYFFQTSKYWTQIYQMAKGTGQPGVNATLLRSINLPIAPIKEQHRIVAAIESYLSRLNDAVASLERAQRNLKRYRTSVLKSAVEGRLVPTEAELARRENRDYEPASVLLERILTERKQHFIQDAAEKGRAKAEAKAKAKGKPWTDEDNQKTLTQELAKAAKKYKEPEGPDTSDLPELPEGWCWAKIDMLASYHSRSIQSGPFGSNLLHSEFQEKGKLVIGIDNVQDGFFSDGSQNRISEEKFQSLHRFRARPGDVLITVMATVGRCCIVPYDLEPSIISKHIYRISVNQQIISPQYLHLCLWGAPIVREQMLKNVQGQTRPGLNGTIIKSLNIPVPPRSEQDRIIGEVDRLLSSQSDTLVSLSHANQRCQTLRQSILKWAFEGKLVDQDPNDEPASVLLERIKAEKAAQAAASKKGGGGKRKKS